MPPAYWLTSSPLAPELLRRADYQSVQVNVDELGFNLVGDAANEPSIAVDPTHPNRIVIGWRQFDTVESDYRTAGWAYSRDAGRTWTFPGVLGEDVFRSDPVLAADPDGNFYYYGLKQDITCDVYKSGDGGVSWGPPVSAYGGDKPWITIDRTGGPGHGNIYAAWSTIAGCCGDRVFTRSSDGGQTFDPPVAVRPGRAPIFGTLTVGPDGEVYLTGRKPDGRGRYFARSSNAQYPGEVPEFELFITLPLGGPYGPAENDGPNPAGGLGQLWVACDHTEGASRGHVHVLCSVVPNDTMDPTDLDPLDMHYNRSEDRGETWGETVRLNDDPRDTRAWQWFGTMAVAPNGRIDAVWYDTRDDIDPGDPEYLPSYSELYYSYSTDGGHSWAENVPLSPPFNHFLGYPQQAKLGDYIDMVSDNVGVNLTYAATFNGEQDIYFLRIGEYDCNGNGVSDGQDIAEGFSADVNGNGIPDECECIGDLDDDGRVSLSDLARLLTNFGAGGAEPDDGDLNGDGNVDYADLLLLLGQYGTSCY